MEKNTKETKDDKNSDTPLLINILDPGPSLPPSRSITLFGDLDEEKIENVCSGLLLLKDVCTEEVPKNTSDAEYELEIVKKPIEFKFKFPAYNKLQYT